MLLYSILMLLTAALLIFVGCLIYRGRTQLINSYHQAKVKDHAAYGRAFGKAMFLFSLGPLLSGLVGLLGDSEPIAVVSLILLFVGFALGLAAILTVQKRYNQGLF